jgi:UDP-N-acetyl-D-galactosamine dehydrogenase
MFNLSKIKICIVGLGYVGLPLAVAFGRTHQTIGFDVNRARIDDLRDGLDHTLETTKEEMLASKNLTFTNQSALASDANFYIVTVPTPIDAANQPDLTPLRKASETIGNILSTGDTVVFESTVYPGATEEVCVPILEELSGLKFNIDFFVGYSPERINPGDKTHRLENILKITAGSTEESANYIDDVYKSIIIAGTFKASSIRVAEAAKVIENTQRDVNIALINELSIIFNKLNIDTEEVLKAAGTKWNFLPFRPGLVGGHCIGVDPYYLTHKAEQVGYHPQMILAGRRINDGMGKYVVSSLVKSMMKKQIQPNGANVLVMGLTFKENCPDIRNTKVTDITNELNEYNINFDVFDPWCNAIEVKRTYGIDLVSEPILEKYDGLIIAVAHDQFMKMSIAEFKALCKDDHVIADLKYALPASESDFRL